MKSISFWLSRLAIVIVAIIPTWYFLSHIADSQFLDNLMGNWFATMIGVIVGIPIALEIHRRQQQAQEKKEQETQEREALTRKAKILSLVKKELEYNRDVLVARPETIKRLDLEDRLKDELWHAFSDGGELQWIRDLQLIDSFSTAYHHIRTIIFLEERLFDAIHAPVPPPQQPLQVIGNIRDTLTQTYPIVLKHIEKALVELRGI
jgi:hypothetical protein